MKNAAKGIETIEGFAAAFNNVDSHGDVIRPGAFTATIEAIKDRPIGLFASHNHNDAKELMGTITHLEERQFGLYFRADISQAPSAQDIAIKAREGHLNEVSIGFIPRETDVIEMDDGRRVLEINEIELIEISLVTRAANPLAQVTLVKQETPMSDQVDNKEPTEIEQKSAPELKETKPAAQEVKQMDEKNMNDELMEKLNSMETQLKRLDEFDKWMSQPQPKTAVDTTGAQKHTNEHEIDLKDEGDYEMFYKALQDPNKFAMEYKELSTLVDRDGGLLVPERMMDEIKKERDRLNKLGGRVRVVPLGDARSLSLRDFDWEPSIAEFHEGDTLTVTDIADIFNKNELIPQDYSILFKVTDKLERKAGANLMPLLLQRAARNAFNDQDDRIMTGTGSNQPLGIVTLLDNLAFNTVNVTSLASGLDYDSLVDCMMKLDEEYRHSGAWYMHKDAIATVMKLKDSQNLPIWNRPVAAGLPPTLLGAPVIETKSLADGNASGETPIVFGDLGEYLMVVDEENRVDIDRSRYFDEKKVAVRINFAYDGVPMDKKAFARIEIT